MYDTGRSYDKICTCKKTLEPAYSYGATNMCKLQDGTHIDTVETEVRFSEQRSYYNYNKNSRIFPYHLRSSFTCASPFLGQRSGGINAFLVVGGTSLCAACGVLLILCAGCTRRRRRNRRRRMSLVFPPHDDDDIQPPHLQPLQV